MVCGITTHRGTGVNEDPGKPFYQKEWLMDPPCLRSLGRSFAHRCRYLAAPGHTSAAPISRPSPRDSRTDRVGPEKRLPSHRQLLPLSRTQLDANRHCRTKIYRGLLLTDAVLSSRSLLVFSVGAADGALPGTPRLRPLRRYITESASDRVCLFTELRCLDKRPTGASGLTMQGMHRDFRVESQAAHFAQTFLPAGGRGVQPHSSTRESTIYSPRPCSASTDSGQGFGAGASSEVS